MLLVDVKRGKRDALVLSTELTTDSELDGQQHVTSDGYGTIPYVHVIDEGSTGP